MLIAIVTSVWVITIVGILIAWSRIGAHTRRLDGIDERAHAEALDEMPLNEAA